MFEILFKKEIKEVVFNFQFAFIFIICATTIPMAFYISSVKYEEANIEYNQLTEQYLNSSQEISYYFVGEGYRPPSPLLIFSKGFDECLPYKISSSNDGTFKLFNNVIKSDTNKFNEESFDFVNIVCSILTLLAFILTYSSISREREHGTLKLILSNSVPRWKIVLSKILGNYLIFIICFTISILIGILLINKSLINDLFNNYLFNVIVIFSITCIYIFLLFILGVLISILSKSSRLALLILFIMWICLSLILPRFSPVIAEKLYPTDSEQYIRNDLDLTNNENQKEIDLLEKKTLDKCLKSNNANSDLNLFSIFIDPSMNYLLQEYDNEIGAQIETMKKNKKKEFDKKLKYYQIRQNNQDLLAVKIAAISPISIYSYLVSEFSNSSCLEFENINNNAMHFQDIIEKEIYNNWIEKNYKSFDGTVITLTPLRDKGFNPKTLKAPVLKYKATKISNVLSETKVFLLELSVLVLLLSFLTFKTFLKYDVR